MLGTSLRLVPTGAKGGARSRSGGKFGALRGDARRKRSASLHGKPSLRPVAVAARIKLAGAPSEMSAMEDDARRDAGAAVSNELSLGQVSLRLVPRRVERTWDA